jgi:hypothetical protein
MTPSQVPDFQAVNHRPSPFLLSEYSVYIGAKDFSRRENSVFLWKKLNKNGEKMKNTDQVKKIIHTFAAKYENSYKS